MSQTLPVGSVTFLFTDIEGSTAKWERDPEAMAEALRLHERICQETIQAAGGTVFKMTGDGSCAVFPQPESAVRAALALRRRLEEVGWPASIAPLRARMGIHSGPAEERDGDYFGPTVNRVAPDHERRPRRTNPRVRSDQHAPQRGVLCGIRPGRARAA